MIIRTETTEDREYIRHIAEQAFGRPAEASLIDALRKNDNVILSLVAIHEEQLVGHILFFPVEIEAESSDQTAVKYAAVGLGPMAVLPPFQGRGIGSALVRAGLEDLKRRDQAAVIVLGHPEYYPRFGFVPASVYGLQSRYDVPDGVFMAMELQPGGLAGKSGTVVYSPEFEDV